MANIDINFAEILKNLKEYGSFKFFVIVIIITLGFFVYVFREDLSTTIREITVKKIEFKQLKNYVELEKSLGNVINKYNISEGFIVYLYQPKDKAFYKEMVLTNSDLVKTLTSLQGFYLDEQAELNDRLEENEFVLLDENTLINKDNFLHEMGFNYLLIRRIKKDDEIIGEIQLLLKDKPSDADLASIKRDVTQIVYKYVL